MPLTVDHLLGTEWQAILGAWEQDLEEVCSIAALERRNRRSKTVRVQPDMVWEHFAAQCCLRELSAHIRHANRRDELVLGKSQQKVTSSLDALPPKPKRGDSAFEVWLRDYRLEQRAEGQQLNQLGFTTGWRVARALEFYRLPWDQQMQYQLLSKASKIQARQARKQLGKDVNLLAIEDQQYIYIYTHLLFYFMFL